MLLVPVCYLISGLGFIVAELVLKVSAGVRECCVIVWNQKLCE